MAKTKQRKFPKQLFVTLAGESDGQYFDANETSNSAEAGDRVAIYELVEVKVKHITHELKSS